MLNKLVVERLAPDRVRLSVGFDRTSLLGTAVMAHPGALIHVELHTPWLYPPREHPYWRRSTDTAQRRRLQVERRHRHLGRHNHRRVQLVLRSREFRSHCAHRDRPHARRRWVEAARRLDPEKSSRRFPMAELAAGVKPAGPRARA